MCSHPYADQVAAAEALAALLQMTLSGLYM